jgi:DNA-binding GntR family transcriptional regulator
MPRRILGQPSPRIRSLRDACRVQRRHIDQWVETGSGRGFELVGSPADLAGRNAVRKKLLDPDGGESTELPVVAASDGVRAIGAGQQCASAALDIRGFGVRPDGLCDICRVKARESATDRVHRILRDAILGGELESGSQHSIYQLAERLEVSRTPVRDAALRLADAGLLTIERNRGIRIRGITVDGIRDIIESRILLEVPAAAAAARSAGPALDAELDRLLALLVESADAGKAREFAAYDREIHRTLLMAAGNVRVVSIVESLRDSTQVLGVSTVGRSRSMHEVRNEHVPIVEAVRRRDASAAADGMRSHLVATGVLLMQQIAQVTGENAPAPWVPRLLPE